MSRFLLCHRHEPAECGIAFAAWKGFDSPLRHTSTVGSCSVGVHRIWWTVEAADAPAALGMLPSWLAQRTEVAEVRDLPIP